MTKTRKIFLDVTVAVRSPFLFRGLAPATLGVDASALRVGDDGPAVIPGDHLRGHLRAAFCTLAREASGSGVDEDLIVRLLGRPSPDGSDDAPERGCLLFGDLVAKETKPASFVTRVEIDDDTGSVKKGALQTVELVAPPGAVVPFQGRLVAFRDGGGGKDLAAILTKALALVPAMGGIKSAGFGEILHDECAIVVGEEKDLVAAAPASSPGDRLAFDIEFDRPILVDADHVAHNILRGGDIVPGGAIKGALARSFAEAGEKPEGDVALTKVMIGHAFPLTDAGQVANRPLPLSLVVAGGELRDAAGHWGKEAFLVGGKVPAFATDWKDEDRALARKAWEAERIDIPGLPRGRTAIDADGVAAEHALFVTVARATAGRRWRFTVERNGIDERKFGRLVETLKLGLHGIGRTDAGFLAVKWEAAALPAIEPLPDDIWPILLETPAVMTDPAQAGSLEDQYKSYFTAEAKAAVDVVAHFSARRIAGRYAAFRHRAYGTGVYRPFEVTEAGSLFLLKGVAKETVETWCRSGLNARLAGGKELDWKNCPFVAGNGYGAISVNSARHRDLAGEVEDV